MPSGGSAASGGFTFQHKVAAYFAVKCLAGQEAHSFDWLGASGQLSEVWLETTDALDDIKLVMVGGDESHLQVKRTLPLSAREDSELAKTCRQLAKAYSELESDSTTQFVIVVSQAAAGTIKNDLQAVLARARDQPETSSADRVAVTAAERDAYNKVIAHLGRELTALRGSAPDALTLRRVLRRTHLVELAVESGGAQEQLAETVLRTSILRDSAQAPNAWSQLVGFCGELARQQSHTDRAGFQRKLTSAGLALQAPSDIRADVEHLQAASAKAMELFAGRAEITLGRERIRIVRDAATALLSEAEKRSLLVIGVAGVGKTGVLADFVAAARYDVVVALAAEEIEARTSVELKDELQLSRPVEEVLSYWPTDNGLLVIDGMDAARDDGTRRALIRLASKVARENDRFRVVVSIRTFDARNNDELRSAFPATADDPVDGYSLPDLADVAHFVVPELTDGELAQVTRQAAAVGAALAVAPEDVRRLAVLPFNLRLLAELVVESGLSDAEIGRLDTQLRLLGAYWRGRVLVPFVEGDDREHLLRSAARQMVDDRRLHVPRSVVQGRSNDALVGLLRDHVLVERGLPEGGVDREIVGFSHNLLFDYAVARLILGVSVEVLVEHLVSEPRLVLTVWPSFDLHFRWLWERELSREPFWEAAMRLAGDARVRPIAKAIAPGVAVHLVAVPEDLKGLFERLDSELEPVRVAAEAFLVQMASALLTEPPADLRVAGLPWFWFVDELSARLRPALAFPVRALVAHLLES